MRGVFSGCGRGVVVSLLPPSNRHTCQQVFHRRHDIPDESSELHWITAKFTNHRQY
jgi:hypothetical protein